MKQKQIPFIRTKKAISRIKKVINGINSGIPLLLEGETGTSKTATAKAAAEEIGQRPIIFSFSSQTTTDELIGRISKNTDSWSGFSFIKGKYTEAFENGHCLILDEINLAHENVLQCIEASLDSQTLSLNISGNQKNHVIEMHPNFHLIATQNPLSNRFSQKRNYLSHKFTSRFQIINFDEIEPDEMIEIATGLSNNIKLMTPTLIQQIVQFHYEWQRNKFSFSPYSNVDSNRSNSSYYVFTIREILRTFKSIESGLTPYESILVNYGSRYKSESKVEIKKLLEKIGISEEYKLFKQYPYTQEMSKKYSIGTNMIETAKGSKFYLSDILKNAFTSSFHLLESCQSILLVGPDGCGKTSIGRWIGELFSSEISKDNNNKFIICNPEMTIADIIGRYVPFTRKDEFDDETIYNPQIEWMYGPVIKAMMDGDCLILDQIDTAPSTILERLNSLFDQIGLKNSKFPVQENLENKDVIVNENFRFIAVSSQSGLRNLSPAFLNRFTIIYIDEQLDTIGNHLSDWINCVIPISKKAMDKSDLNLITKSIREQLNKDSQLTSYNLSKCVKSYFMLKEKFKTPNDDDKKSIIDFCLDACIYHTSTVPRMSDNFINVMLSNLEDDISNNSQFDTFHFKGAKSTKNIMATLVACSIIRLHVILIGKTGLGKTAAAMAFAKTNKLRPKKLSPHIISFNGETQLDELYGYFTIEKGNFSLHQGQLAQAMSEGQVFIADELNLADSKIIQSLNVAIEPSSGESIILPVIGSSITVENGFFFIGCQNDLTMNGRKPIPESIKKKILCIKYPEPSRDDFITLCKSIAKQFSLDDMISHCTASLIHRINSDPLFKCWSLREIRILFRRISYFQNKPQEYKGFTPIHHIAFMLISPYKGDKVMIQKIVNYIQSSFKPSINQLQNDILSKVKVEKYLNKKLVNQEQINLLKEKQESINNPEYLIKLKKGSLEMTIYNAQLFYIPDNIENLWQTVFEINLTHYSEPLLLNGPSSFKTYLAGLISSLAPIIYLHSDSTVSSLIGQITLLDRHQAKLSLLESIFDFIGYNSNLKTELKNIKQDLEENDIFNINSLLSAVNNIKKGLPESFIPIIENVIGHLIKIQKEDNEGTTKNGMFSKYISLFKPGLITRSILSQNSLILKNFAKPSPTVIERFNELLSVTPTLTLFEDTSNTFTTPDNDKMHGFSTNFRIIGICHPNEKRNLSDAMLSRLTEIYVPEYSISEQNNVFRTYMENVTGHEDPLNVLNKSLEIFEKNSIHVSFSQKIKIIQVANKWQKKFPEMNILTIYMISILRCAGGPLPFELKQKMFSLMKDTFYPKNDTSIFPSNLSVAYNVNILNEPESNSFKYTKQNSCLALTNDENNITSTLTNFSYLNLMPIKNELKDKPDMQFSYSNIDLVDLIFSFSIINFPLILEGPNGCGKSSVFFYIAKYLDIKVIQISISRSTTVEDLFGRYEPISESESVHFQFRPTEFLNAIDNSKNRGEKYWILIEELHLASPSVIDALEPIFNPQSDQITLPDGSFVQKGNFFIVGLLSKPLQKQSILNKVLYYVVRNYTKNEFYEITKYILEGNGINKEEAKRVCQIFAQLYEISSSSQIKVPITLREAHKFIKMIESAEMHTNPNNAYSLIDITQTLLLGRFFEKDLRESIIQEVNEVLQGQGFPEKEEIPNFAFKNDFQILASKKLKISTHPKDHLMINNINHLSQSQRQLFEFLILNIDKYAPIAVQGPTASGKTYTIQLFADIIGKNLKILQLNSEINGADIAGSYCPTSDLSKSDIDKLQHSFSYLSDFILLLPQKFQSNIDRLKVDKWKPIEISELRKCVVQLLLDGKIDDEDIPKAKEFIRIVNSTLLFFNHIERNDSLIIQAMVNGDWLLLDGIESAPSDFLDRLFTLLDDIPTLNLYERGEDQFYSMYHGKDDKTKLIHPEFRLFMTYNPVGTFSNNVSSSFLSRCSLYSLNPIDSNLNDSAILVLGIIDKTTFTFSSSIEISAKIAIIHMKMKEKQQNQLTCRALIHISREICYKNENQNINQEDLIDIIYNHYLQGNQNMNSVYPKLLLNEIKSVFDEKVDDRLIEYLKDIETNNMKVRNIMIKIIKNFHSQLKQACSSDKNMIIRFKFTEFINNLRFLQFKEYEKIIDEINIIKQFIEENKHVFNKEQISHLASIGTIFDLLDLINTEQKKQKYSYLSLDSNQIQNNDKFSFISFRYQLLIYLHDNNIYLENIPAFFINKDILDNYLKLYQPKYAKKAIKSLSESVYFPFLEIPENVSEMENTPYNWSSNISFLQQICSSLFKVRDCSFLFTGLMRELFIGTFIIFEKNDFNIFYEWLNWMEEFFQVFWSIIFNFNISIDQFKNQMDKWKNEQEINKTPNSIKDFSDQMEKLKNLKEIDKTIPSFGKIFNLIDELFSNFQKTYLAMIKNKESAEKFFLIKKKIEKYMGDDQYKISLGYLNNYIDLFSQNINAKDINFLDCIFNSIIKEKKTDNHENSFSWPTLQIYAPNEHKQNSLIESLIAFSLEMNALKKLNRQSPTWSAICLLSQREALITEYISNREISLKTIDQYKSYLNARLLVSIFESDSKDYCNESQIINFFNQFVTRNNHISDEWFIIAQNLSKKYPSNLCILIPHFNPFDIISLLVNPLTKEMGPIFQDINIPNDLINEFNLLNLEDDSLDYRFVRDKIEEITIEYIQQNYSIEINSFEDLLDQIKENDQLSNIQNWCQQIGKVIEISDLQTEDESLELDYSDILDIDFKDFENFLDKNPCVGFYIAQFPETKRNLSSIKKELKKYSFPLGLFQFRIFSRVNCIIFQLPSAFPSAFAEEFQNIINNQIVSNLNDNEITNFSNFIGFLLSNKPDFIKRTNYSEYLRNIIINLLTTPTDITLQKEIMNVLKSYLPEIIENLGSPNWDSLINQELHYDDSYGTSFEKFLVNPWRLILEEINETITDEFQEKEQNVRKVVNKIIEMILKLTSKESLNKLLECTKSDESALETKIVDDYSNCERKTENDNIKKSISLWNNYCKLLKTYFHFQIQELPNNPKEFTYCQNPSHKQFYDFFSEPKQTLSGTKQYVIAIKPSSTNIKLTYIIMKTQNSIDLCIDESTDVILFLSPQNIKPEKLNLNCVNGDIEYINVQYNDLVGIFQKATIDTVIDSYNNFQKSNINHEDSYLTKNDLKEISKKIGHIEVVFGTSFIDDFCSILKKLNDKYNDFKIESYYQREDILDEIIDDISELDKFTTITFNQEKVEKPHKTIEFLSEQLTNIVSYKKNLNSSNFDLFNDEYIKRHDLFFDESKEFQKYLNMARSINFEPKESHIAATEEEIMQVIRSSSLLTPTIFKNKNVMDITINAIDIDFGPLLFGVDITPLQIKLCNSTSEEIQCIFTPTNTEDLHSFSSRNEPGFLIIEIPVESICKSSLNYKKDKKRLNIEHRFVFKGKISLSTKNAFKAFATIDYRIKLTYISLVSFIKIRNKHSFAIKEGKAEIVPFIAAPDTKIEIQKITNLPVKYSDSNNIISELNDNKANKPIFKTQQDNDDERISNIEASIIRSPLENSYLSMNFELGLTKENIIPIGIHIDTFPKNNNLSLSIFSDSSKNFVKKDGIINIGNLKRKIYLLIECLNTKNIPLSLSSSMIEIESSSPFIKAEYNESLNKNTIQPNKYGSIVCFIEASYFGLPKFKKSTIFDGEITINILNNTQKIDFKYKINCISIQNKDINKEGEMSKCCCCNQGVFEDIDLQSNGYQKDFWNEKYQILVTPFCFAYYDKNRTPKIKYSDKGTFISINNFRKEKYEVLEFIKNKGFVVNDDINDENDLSLRKNHIIILARIKGKPETFFPLFEPKQNIKSIFDSRKYSFNDIEGKFCGFFLELIDDKYNYTSKIKDLFENYSKKAINNYSLIFSAIGSNYKDIKFSRFIKMIVDFTKCPSFQKHYDDSINILGNDHKYQYFSFISALNEIVYTRFGQIRSCDWCISPLFPIKNIQNKQESIFKSTIDEGITKKSSYYRNSLESIKNSNSIYTKNQYDYKNKGYEVTKILKWTEMEGLIPSDEEEMDECLEKKILYISKIEPKINPVLEIEPNITDVITKIDFPETVTIKSLYEMFDKLISETYILPFEFYSSKNHVNFLNQLNKLISIFFWQEEFSECFPFKSFLSDFKLAFISMITRLKKAKLEIKSFPYDAFKNYDSYNYNFIKLPTSIPINLTATKFTYPGRKIAIYKPVKTINNYPKRSFNIKSENPKRDYHPSRAKTTKIVYYDNEEGHKIERIIPTFTNVVFKEITENAKEIPDTDFIQYLVNEMIQDNIDPKQTFEYNPTANKHKPNSIQNIKEIGSHNLRIDAFLEASKQLSNTLIDAINKKISPIDSSLVSNNSIYASILVDCSSTLSISQKAALSTLAIAIGNVLTSIRIPYSIIIFCESNFQYVLKQFDDNHDLIHFEKLLDTITIRRRMSDLPSAILMADSLTKPKDGNRTNHSVFVLTDGLTKQLRHIELWQNKILNNSKRSVFFFFYDVLSQINQNNVHPIWNMFREKIKDAKSPNVVVYSNSSSIYNGNSIFAEPFVKVLKKFKDNKEKNKLNPPSLATPITDLSDEFLDNIEKYIEQGIVNDDKFYAQCSFPKEISDKYSDIDLNMVQLNPLESFVAGLSGDIKIQSINAFLNNLMSYANSLINTSIYQEIGSYVFPLNSPTQYAPSESGSIFHFPNVIKFILTRGQDSKIFLEKKTGLVRSHSIFFVIDNSVSCFNASTFTHSFQTVFSLLYPFSKIDIPSLNIIITTENGPVALCLETPSMIALDQNSPLWVSLFTHLSNPHSVNSCLHSALLAVYQIRIQQQQDLSVIFTLTDGCYSFNDRNQFNSIFKSLKATPITIGIGMNPANIGLMTEKAIWSSNPRNIWSSILYLFGKEIKIMPENGIQNCFSSSLFDQEAANKLDKYLTVSDKVFPNLFNELNRVKRLAATYRDFYNQSQSASSFQKDIKQQIDDSSPKEKPTSSQSLQSSKTVYDQCKNANGTQYDLGKKDYYKGVNLLIVMCWDFTCSILENEQISEEVLINGADNNVSVVKALSFFGIQTKIVKNYIDAINELTKGGYSQVWIICGRMDGTMPGNSDPNTNSANLIDAFIECVIKYWHLGGGVVFWTDNYPLTAEVNKFLEKATFKKQNSDNSTYDEIKVNFHIGGDFPGERIMTRHNKVFDHNSPFNCFENNEISTVGGYEKELFNHELYEIFEGSTIASAIKGTENPGEWQDYKNINKFADMTDIAPFEPFSKSSSGGFSSLFYISSEDIDDGNIIIDCGFSKLFIELTEEGIDRYVKNIAVWMLQIEKKDIKYGNTKDPRLVAPPKFDFNIDDYHKIVDFHHFKESKNVDIVFLVDGSKSMDFFKMAVCECCQEIAQKCKEKLPMNDFRFGAVVYRDTAVTEKIDFREADQVDYNHLTDDPTEIYTFFNNLVTKGGGRDGPEDWVSGYEYLLSDKMEWSDDSAKIVIHICDAPGHGNLFFSEPQFKELCCVVPCFNRDNDENTDRAIYEEIQTEQDIKFTELIQQAARRGLMFFCLNNHKNAMYCLNKVKEIYYKNNGIKFVIQNQFYENNQNEEDKKNILIDKVKDIVISALDLSVAVLRQSQKDFEKSCSDQFESDYNKYIISLQDSLRNKRRDFNNYYGSKYQKNKNKRKYRTK